MEGGVAVTMALPARDGRWGREGKELEAKRGRRAEGELGGRERHHHRGLARRHLGPGAEGPNGLTKYVPTYLKESGDGSGPVQKVPIVEG